MVVAVERDVDVGVAVDWDVLLEEELELVVSVPALVGVVVAVLCDDEDEVDTLILVVVDVGVEDKAVGVVVENAGKVVLEVVPTDKLDEVVVIKLVVEAKVEVMGADVDVEFETIDRVVVRMCAVTLTMLAFTVVPFALNERVRFPLSTAAANKRPASVAVAALTLLASTQSTSMPALLRPPAVPRVFRARRRSSKRPPQLFGCRSTRVTSWPVFCSTPVFTSILRAVSSAGDMLQPPMSFKRNTTPLPTSPDPGLTFTGNRCTFVPGAPGLDASDGATY